MLPTPRASSSTPSSRTEARLKEAIKALQEAVRKSSRGYLKAVKVPSLNHVDSLELTAEELAASIGSLLHGREEYKNNPDRAQKIKEIAEKWFMASFPFAKVLLTIGKSATSAAQLNIYSLPCDALLLLGQIAYDEAKKAKDIDEALHFLSDKVERVTLLKQVPADTFTKDKAGRAALEICAAVFNYLAVAIKTFRHSALTNMLITAVSGTQNFTDARIRVDDAIRDYNAAIADLGLDIGLKTKEKTEEVLVTVQETKNVLFDQEAARMRERFRRWLSSSAGIATAERDRLLVLQKNSSPDWIFQHATFRNWINGSDASSNTIWLSATAGFGKSVLSAYLTVELQTRFPSNPVTFFLCKEKSELSQFSQIVRTLLRQLVQVSPATFDYIHTIWEEDDDIADLTASYSHFFSKLLIPALKYYYSTTSNFVFIVLDGLNELPSGRLNEVLALVNILADLNNSADGSPVRVILTSQPTTRITAGLSHAVTTVHLTGNDNVENVEVYVKAALNESITKLFDSAGRDPIAYFRKNHFGMFLWVKAILELLQSLDVTSDLQKILDNPPRTINDVYQRVLERLSDELNEYELPWIKEIISWSVMSKRDMTLAELQVAILLSNGENEEALNARVINIRSTLGKCAAILQVSQGPTSTHEFQTVSLLHNTFRQFITNPGAQGPVGTARKFLVIKPDTDSKMASACLKYLMRSEIVIDQDKFLPNARRKLLNSRFPLFNYATLFWSGHLTNKASPESRDKVTAQLQVFFQRNSLRTWINSVMAYTYNTAQGSLFDPVSWSVTTSLKASIAWICRSPVTTLKIIVGISKQSSDLWVSVKQRVGGSTSMETLFKTWCASIAAELWVVTNPRYWEVSIRCFDIATALAGLDGPNTTFESTVRATAGLAQLTCNPDGFNWLVNHSNVYLYNEWQHEVLALATTVLHSALQIATDPIQKAMALSRLSTVYRNYYQSTSSLDDLNKAIGYESQCLVVSSPEEDPDYEAYLEIAACDLFVRAEINGASAGEVAESSHEDCRKAAKMTIEALHLTLTSHFNLGSASSVLPAVDVVTFNVLSGLRDQTAEGEGVDLPPGVFRILSTLSYGLSVQQTTAIQVDGDIRDFVKICKNALSCTTEHNPALWSTLGSAYYSFYRAAQTQNSNPNTGNKEPISLVKEEKTDIEGVARPNDPKLEDLNECIECYRKAISLTPNGHPTLSAMRNNLGRALEMYQDTGPHLDEAIDCFRQAVQSTPEDRIDLVAYLFNLAGNLRRRKASDNDTEEAILYYRRIVKLAPERHVLLPMTWNNLGHIYYGRDHESDHREAIKCYRMALKYLPKGHRNAAAYANNLANTLKKVAQLPEQYTEAIQYYQLAVDTVHRESDKVTYYSNLALALLERLHDDDISRVIDCYTKCIELCTDDRAKIAEYEMNLGKAFWQRGKPEDLVVAEEWLVKARKDIEPNEMRNCLNLLGLTLSKRNGAGDLDKAVEYHREAIKAAEGSNYLSVFESNLGKALVKRDRYPDKVEAVSWFQKAVDHAGDNDSAIAQYCSLIGEIYAVDVAKRDDLTKAVTWYRKAVKLETEDHKKLAGYLTALGDTLQNLQEGPESVEVTKMALALTSEDDVSYPLRLTCLGTALKNVDWPLMGTHGTNTLNLPCPSNWYQNNIVEAALNVFSRGASFENVDEPLALIRQALHLYKKVGDEEGIVSCESALVDCVMIDYTYHRASSSMTEATEIFRRLFAARSRDNKECRGWDGIRFGALIIKEYCEGLPVLAEDLELLVDKTEGYREDDDQLRWTVEVVEGLREHLANFSGGRPSIVF